jgi:hypothetical protein
MGEVRSSWEEQNQIDPNIANQNGTKPPDKKESSAWSDLAKIFGALAVNKMSTPSTSTTPYIVQQPTGMSPTTMLIGGGLALAAVLILMKD